MKTKHLHLRGILAGAALSFATSIAAARTYYGVTTVSTGRSAVVVKQPAAVVVKQPTVVVQPKPAYVVQTGVSVTTVAVAPPPVSYIYAVPSGAPVVVYGGYNCYVVNSVYYRPVFYGGRTVYVTVR